MFEGFDYGQELPIIYVIVSFCFGKGFRVEGCWNVIST